MVISPDGGRNGGGRAARGGYLRPPPPEHSYKVYCEQAHYVPVFGGGMDSGVKCYQAVVGVLRTEFGGYVGGGLGGRMVGKEMNID